MFPTKTDIAITVYVHVCLIHRWMVSCSVSQKASKVSDVLHLHVPSHVPSQLIISFPKISLKSSNYLFYFLFWSTVMLCFYEMPDSVLHLKWLYFSYEWSVSVDGGLHPWLACVSVMHWLWRRYFKYSSDEVEYLNIHA